MWAPRKLENFDIRHDVMSAAMLFMKRVIFFFASILWYQGIEDLCTKRDELQKQIINEEEEKGKIQNDIRILSERLAKINESLAKKIASRNEYDKTIAETEAAYMKVSIFFTACKSLWHYSPFWLTSKIFYYLGHITRPQAIGLVLWILWSLKRTLWARENQGFIWIKKFFHRGISNKK